MPHWDGSCETEEKIKKETKATIRCIPQDVSNEEGVCIYSGKGLLEEFCLFHIKYVRK